MLAESPTPKESEWFPVLSNDDAWARLPAAESGAGAPLPAWARVTAATLPRTTATILELDDLHRTKSPLDPKLRAMVRWVVADANRCRQSQAIAVADLKRVGASDAEVAALRGDRSVLNPDTRRVLDVARELTRAAYKVTDDQMAALKHDLDESRLVALVQLVAFGNFQDRLILSLGVPTDEPRPPTGVRFKRPWVGGEAPARPPFPEMVAGAPEMVADSEWRSIDFAAMKKAMEGQKEREPRVSVPSFAEVKKHLPEGARPLRIKWSLVCVGHSPVLALPWTAGLRTFAEESKQDRVFEELLFWVVTRELQCFY
ncbi:MAG TPA: carboxymuconolactone decarboxylase family protein [Gemmataceae bacterium]|nr:carboxymuconolactone decarboxylase family protein [Gemmataceae bacterium]